MVLESPYDIARLHARQFQNEHNMMLSSGLNNYASIQLLKALNIEHVILRNTQLIGRLEIGDENRPDKIFVNDNKTKEGKANIIAHEIGHWYLRKHYPDIERNKPLWWKEAYASSFAMELCIPISKRNKIISKLLTAESAQDILEIKKGYSVSFVSFLRVLYGEVNSFDIQTETQNIWIIAKWSINRNTLVGGKLRVVGTFFNPRRYYIPDNKGLDGLINNIGEINDMGIGEIKEFQTILNVAIKNGNIDAKFKNKKINSLCSVKRLRENTYDNLSYYIMLFRFSSASENL